MLKMTLWLSNDDVTALRHYLTMTHSRSYNRCMYVGFNFLFVFTIFGVFIMNCCKNVPNYFAISACMPVASNLKKNVYLLRILMTLYPPLSHTCHFCRYKHQYVFRWSVSMSRNKCFFFHVRISHILRFISVCGLFTDSPPYLRALNSPALG
jgi:hypothetical protein